MKHFFFIILFCCLGYAYAADGGLYAELIQNRSFEYNPSDVNWGKNPHNNWYYFTAWGLERKNAICTISLESSSPLHPNNPHYLVFDALTTGPEGVGIRNDGYDGIVLRKGETYHFSVFLRLLQGENIPVKIRLTDPKDKNRILAEAEIKAQSATWQKYTATLIPVADADQASLLLLFQQKGKIAIDMVSLFPKTTIWGKKRAEAGHPEPFHLEYLGVGNEDKITPDFEVRFRMIADAIKEKYPEIKIIGTSGPFSDGEDFEAGWRVARSGDIAMVDEHYYKDTGWFLKDPLM